MFYKIFAWPEYVCMNLTYKRTITAYHIYLWWSILPSKETHIWSYTLNTASIQDTYWEITIHGKFTEVQSSLRVNHSNTHSFALRKSTIFTQVFKMDLPLMTTKAETNLNVSKSTRRIMNFLFSVWPFFFFF